MLLFYSLFIIHITQLVDETAEGESIEAVAIMRWVGIAWVEVEIVAIGFIKNIAKSRRCFGPTTAVVSGFTEYGITARMDKTATDEVKRG